MGRRRYRPRHGATEAIDTTAGAGSARVAEGVGTAPAPDADRRADLLGDDDLLLAGGEAGVGRVVPAAEGVPRAVVEPEAAGEQRTLHAPVAAGLALGDPVPHGVGLGAVVGD